MDKVYGVQDKETKELVGFNNKYAWGSARLAKIALSTHLGKSWHSKYTVVALVPERS